MIWRVGMKVVCIHGGKWPLLRRGFIQRIMDRLGYFPNPVEGRIYTIISVGQWHIREYAALWFAECGPACSYRSDKFKPVVSTKTDISIFHRMLTPSRVSEPV